MFVRACACVRPAHLVTAGAARPDDLGVVTLAVQVLVVVAVGQVHQQLFARAAHEAGRVPVAALAHFGGRHHQLPAVDLALAAVARLQHQTVPLVIGQNQPLKIQQQKLNIQHHQPVTYPHRNRPSATHSKPNPTLNPHQPSLINTYNNNNKKKNGNL